MPHWQKKLTGKHAGIDREPYDCPGDCRQRESHLERLPDNCLIVLKPVVDRNIFFTTGREGKGKETCCAFQELVMFVAARKVQVVWRVSNGSFHICHIPERNPEPTSRQTNSHKRSQAPAAVAGANQSTSRSSVFHQVRRLDPG